MFDFDAMCIDILVRSAVAGRRTLHFLNAWDCCERVRDCVTKDDEILAVLVNGTPIYARLLQADIVTVDDIAALLSPAHP